MLELSEQQHNAINHARSALYDGLMQDIQGFYNTLNELKQMLDDPEARDFAKWSKARKFVDYADAADIKRAHYNTLADMLNGYPLEEVEAYGNRARDYLAAAGVKWY